MTKYHAQKDRRGGLTFDSRAEAKRFDQLMLRLRAGEIRNLKLQVRYCLQEAYTALNGERVRSIDYIADFVYERKTAPDANGDVYWLPVVEDVKGMRTHDFAIKAKLFRSRYGFPITEVKM